MMDHPDNASDPLYITTVHPQINVNGQFWEEQAMANNPWQQLTKKLKM
jgi:hypothetical protein